MPLILSYVEKVAIANNAIKLISMCAIRGVSFNEFLRLIHAGCCFL